MADIGNREYHCSVSCYKYIKKKQKWKAKFSEGWGSCLPKGDNQKAESPLS